MKKLTYVLTAVLFLLSAVITFYSLNLFYSVVSNYEAITKVIFVGFPMYMLVADIIAVMFFVYRSQILKKNSEHMRKLYLLLVLIFSTIGLVFSIITGTYVYGSFTKSYVFIGYPLVMLIVHALLVIASGYLFAKTVKKINAEQITKNEHSTAKHVFFTIGMSLFLLFALDRLGALLLLPLLASPRNGHLAIPYYIQLAVPTIALVCALVYKNCDIKNKEAFKFISLLSIVVFSAFSMIFTIMMSKIYANDFVNTISNIQHIERLVKYPVVFGATYIIGLLLPLISLIIQFFKKIFKSK